jgi:hypothetical protein
VVCADCGTKWFYDSSSGVVLTECDACGGMLVPLRPGRPEDPDEDEPPGGGA